MNNLQLKTEKLHTTILFDFTGILVKGLDYTVPYSLPIKLYPRAQYLWPFVVFLV